VGLEEDKVREESIRAEPPVGARVAGLGFGTDINLLIHFILSTFLFMFLYLLRSTIRSL
jgi:hypothetical protein